MADSTEENTQGWLVPSLLIATGLWIAVAIGLVSFGDACQRPNDAIIVACMTANEMGDFLAGVFAPLALLWLAAAVFIQSKELRAQRSELSLTRKELELSREVAIEAKEATKLQAKEANRSGDYFQQQTEILNYEHVLRQQAEAASAFEEYFKHTNKETADCFQEVRFIMRNESPIAIRIEYELKADALERLANLVVECDSFFCQKSETIRIAQRYSLDYEGLQSTIEFLLHRNSIFEEMGKKLSPADQLRLDVNTFRRRVHTLKLLSDVLEQNKDKYAL